MDARSCQLLELPEVQRRAAVYAAFPRSRELILELEPATEHEAVRARLQRTSEGRRLIVADRGFSVGGAHDVRALTDLAARNARLDPTQLRVVGDQLRAVRRTRQALHPRRTEFPDLWSLVDPLEPITGLERRINATVQDGDAVLDTASGKLASIRVKLRTGHADLECLMHSVVRSPDTRRLLQEPIVTQRAGRLVVPVKQEHRMIFGGIVHDVSASGATLFMEPVGAIDANNLLRELEAAERHEIEHILRELSAEIGAQCKTIVAGVEGLAALDVALSLARYAESLDAVAPVVAPDNHFHLLGARHPLLTGKVVAIDVELGPGELDGFSALVVTGPNTGGKTVALKTVGLIHLMAACGMHVPAAPGSVVAVYRSVLVDIGDEQSIEQSLSTFSSHMRNLVEMIQRARSGVLVLADELGAGTDPSEGAALAHTILERLLDSGAAVMVTTHHPELKTFAYTDSRARNVSVEFEAATLQPTYRLVMDVPGKSNALAIAQRLGLDPALIDVARARLHRGQQDFEDAISAIHTEREATARVLEQAEAAARAADVTHAELDERLDGLESERHEILRDARREARGLIAQARGVLRKAARAARPSDHQRLTSVRNHLRELAERIDLPGKPAAQDLACVPPALAVGDHVELEGFSAEAEVIAVHGRDIEVRVGSMRTRVPLTLVRDVVGPPSSPSPAPTAPLPGVGMAEIVVRGQRSVEAIEMVELALDRAVLTGSAELRVIHGRGTGALRRAVREHLVDHPIAAATRDAPLREGGDGVTIIALRERLRD